MEFIKEYWEIAVAIVGLFYFVVSLTISSKINPMLVSMKNISDTLIEIKAWMLKSDNQANNNAKDIAKLEGSCEDLREDINTAHEHYRQLENRLSNAENEIGNIKSVCEERRQKSDA